MDDDESLIDWNDRVELGLYDFGELFKDWTTEILLEELERLWNFQQEILILIKRVKNEISGREK